MLENDTTSSGHASGANVKSANAITDFKPHIKFQNLLLQSSLEKKSSQKISYRINGDESHLAGIFGFTKKYSINAEKSSIKVD